MKNEIIKMMVPAVGESINEVTISSWLKNDGDIHSYAPFTVSADITGKTIP